MVVHKRLLDRAGETLGLSLHPGRPGVRVPAPDPLPFQRPGAVRPELAPLSERKGSGAWGRRGQPPAEGSGRMPGVPGRNRPDEGNGRDGIDEGDDRPAHAVSDPLDRLAGRRLQGLGRDRPGRPGLDVPAKGLSSYAAIEAGTTRMRSGARAMMRPRVEDLKAFPGALEKRIPEHPQDGAGQSPVCRSRHAGLARDFSFVAGVPKVSELVLMHTRERRMAGSAPSIMADVRSRGFALPCPFTEKFFSPTTEPQKARSPSVRGPSSPD
jgi:hypothetical protein